MNASIIQLIILALSVANTEWSDEQWLSFCARIEPYMYEIEVDQKIINEIAEEFNITIVE